MTAEDLQFLINLEIKRCIDDGKNKWVRISNNTWELWITELHVVQLEEYIKDRINKYLNIIDTLYDIKTKRHMGDKIRNTRIQVPYCPIIEDELDGPEDIDIGRAVLILNYFGGPGDLRLHAIELLDIDGCIRYEASVYKSTIEDEIQKHLTEIGKLSENLEKAEKRMKEKGYIM